MEQFHCRYRIFLMIGRGKLYFMNRHFIPVKITEKKYADRFVKGEIFMRALHEFGAWGDISEKDDVLKNNYRGDLYSGVTAVFRSADDCRYFKKIEEEKGTKIQNCCLIDESDIQYFKILSLYCSELDEEKQRFITPDPRMASFGDTAVLIIDFCEFMERYARALFAKYGRLITMVDQVKPFDFSQTHMINPLFCKHESQAYQKELRLAFGSLEVNPFAIGPDAYETNSMVMNYDPVTLQLGDLSDITVQMPIWHFMAGFLPPGFKCRWPSNEPPKVPTNYDGVRTWTQEQMKKYRSIHVTPAYKIDGEMHYEEMMPFVELIKLC